MEQLIQQLINRLVALESEFDSLPDLSIIQELIKEIEALKQNETFTKETLKDAVTMFGDGYFTDKQQKIIILINETASKINKDATVLIDDRAIELSKRLSLEISQFKTDYVDKAEQFKKTLVKMSNDYQIEVDNKVNNAIAELKSRLKLVKNGIDGKNGRDGVNGKDGVGIEGKKGRDGIDGVNGVGIDDITYKSNTITIFLSNGTKKEIRLNIPTYLGGGGGISETRVSQMISEAMTSALDAYTKEETQTSLPKIGFDTTNTTTPNIGQLAWNIDDSTLDLGLNGSTLQIGQETLVKVRNSHNSTITNGQVVMAVGTIGNSGRILVNPHTGLRSNAKQILGIATEDIAINTDGFVTMFGKVRGINTTGSIVGETWNDGDVLYLKSNDNGNLTKIAPQNNEVNMPIAIVVHSHTNGSLFVRISGVDENAFYSNVYSKSEIDIIVGDINSALDTINGEVI